MRRKLYKSRRGQISTEIMYAVGVMIVIFLLLSGISFNRRSELRAMDDYLQKRDACLKISNTIASLSASGFHTRAIFPISNPVTIYNNGRIVISPSVTSSEETPCTYAGKAYTGAGDSISLTGDGHNYCFFSGTEQVYIFEDTDPTLCFQICTLPDPSAQISPGVTYLSYCGIT